MTSAPPNAPSIDPAAYARSVRALLTEDPRRYRNFGVYWYFVKALLRRYFDRHEMPILGDYQDPSVIERMPKGLSAADMLQAAAEEYQHNAMFNLGRTELEDPEGEKFTLLDPDIDT
jgi:hypothetical protein